MNVANLMAEIATALGSISGLRVYNFVAGAISPPTAIVGLPDAAEFDLTYQRGADRLTLPVTVLLSKAEDRVSAKTLANYLSGSGALSIKAAIESHDFTEPDWVRVVSAEVSIVTVAAVDYLAATFQLDVVGGGL